MKRKSKIIFLIALIGVIAAVVSCSKYKDGKTGDIMAENGDNGFITVSDISELRKVDGESVSAVVTRGYNREGDGCGFIYYRDNVLKNAKEDGGRVIVGDDGTRWRAEYQGSLPIRLFGAVGDGSTDDTEAIKNWLAAVRSEGSGYAQTGKYLFSEQLVLPQKDNICIFGDGPQQTVFVYNGKETDKDLIVGGSSDSVLYGWVLHDFNVESETALSGGAALHLINLKHSCKIQNVSFGSLSGKRGTNLYNGLWLDRCSVTDYVGFEIQVKNEGIMVSGTDGDDSSADILIDQGTIVGSKIGIHCGGGFGGLYIRQVLIYGCMETGYLQDNALAKRGNREIFIFDQCVLDACHAYCALIDDTESEQCTLQFDAFISGAGWISPAKPGAGLCIRHLRDGRVSIGSSHIKHCISDGIQIGDKSTYVAISPTTYIVGNGGYGIVGASGNNKVSGNPVFVSNSKGNIK